MVEQYLEFTIKSLIIAILLYIILKTTVSLIFEKLTVFKDTLLGGIAILITMNKLPIKERVKNGEKGRIQENQTRKEG